MMKNNIRTVMRQINQTGIALLLVFACSAVYGVEVVVATGVATPQSDSEVGNIEVLRERAIRSAMDMALRRVSGETISSERGGSSSSRERITSVNDKFEERTSQNIIYHQDSISRSTGYSRIVEILKEWQDDKQYFVKAKIEVGTEKEVTKSVNAGFYWERAGKPPISIHFTELTNGDETTPEEGYTLRFLRDNLASNGIKASSSAQQNKGYQVNVMQEYDVKEMTNFGTLTVNCKLTFQVVDEQSQETLAEHRAKHGPKAGFTLEQGQEDCIRAIAPDVSRNLVKKIALIMNDKWKLGSEYQLTITGMPGEFMTRARDIIGDLHRVKRHSLDFYRDEILQIRMHYEGRDAELVEALIMAFDDEDMKVVPESMQNNQIHLKWVTTSN